MEPAAHAEYAGGAIPVVVGGDPELVRAPSPLAADAGGCAGYAAIPQRASTQAYDDGGGAPADRLDEQRGRRAPGGMDRA